MFDQKIKSFHQLPLKDKDRKCTDTLCTCFGFVFFVTLLVLAFVFMNKDHYFESNFPTDSDNLPCGYGQNQGYNYLYLPNINDKQSRICVSSCPQSPRQHLQCKKTKSIQSCQDVKIYPTQPDFKRLGGICAPLNQQGKTKMIQTLNLTQKRTFLKTYDIIRLSLLISLVIGILWMLIVHFLPLFATLWAIFLGSLILIASGIIMIVHNPQGWHNNLIRFIGGPILILFGIIFACMMFIYRRRIKITGILLKYSKFFLSSKPANLLYIPIFIILICGLIALCLFQYMAFSSYAQPNTRDQSIYNQLTRNLPLTILVVIQFIWGMQFLKDSFNFIISCNASEWYIKGNNTLNCCNPVSRLFRYHLGSVIGGSFLNAFFNFVDFLFQLFRCYPEGPCGLFSDCCYNFSKFFGCFFDLVRNDAYTYINLTGIPYCNAARNCQVLCKSSNLFIGTQSVVFFYRLCAHIFCVGTTAIICYWLMVWKLNAISLQAILIIILLSYCIVTYFIDIHADAGQALQISYLVEQNISGNNGNGSRDIQNLKVDLNNLKHSYQDGKC